MALNPNDNSAQPCGCDPGVDWVCEYHMRLSNLNSGTDVRDEIPTTNAPRFGLPTTDAARKAIPLWDGTFGYFPDALIEVARVSMAGNKQHNPGQPLHWAREKSTDHTNTAARHMLDHTLGTEIDTDDCWHLAKAAWRNLAALQLAIEKRRKK